MRWRDIDQVAHSLHVGLPGKYPEVADKDRPDLFLYDLIAFLERHLDRVGSTGGYADQLAVVESHPIGQLAGQARVEASRDHRRVDQLGIHGRPVEHDGNHRAIFTVALNHL